MSIASSKRVLFPAVTTSPNSFTSNGRAVALLIAFRHSRCLSRRSSSFPNPGRGPGALPPAERPYVRKVEWQCTGDDDLESHLHGSGRRQRRREPRRTSANGFRSGAADSDPPFSFGRNRMSVVCRNGVQEHAASSVLFSTVRLRWQSGERLHSFLGYSQAGPTSFPSPENQPSGFVGRPSLFGIECTHDGGKQRGGRRFNYY